MQDYISNFTIVSLTTAGLFTWLHPKKVRKARPWLFGAYFVGIWLFFGLFNLFIYILSPD